MGKCFSSVGIDATGSFFALNIAFRKLIMFEHVVLKSKQGMST